MMQSALSDPDPATAALRLLEGTKKNGPGKAARVEPKNKRKRDGDQQQNKSPAFLNLREAMLVSLFPSIEWGNSDDDSSTTEEGTEATNDTGPGTSSEDGDNEHANDDYEDDRRKSQKRLSLTITLFLMFRFLQDYAASLALCSAIVVGRTAYSFVTQFGGVTQARELCRLDLWSHQEVDSSSLHALMTAMFVYPDVFGSHAHPLALVLAATQPLHLSLWFKSNFGLGHHSDGRVLIHIWVWFAVPWILLLQWWWTQSAGNLVFWAGILGLNLAPLYPLYHSIQRQIGALVPST